MRYHYRHPESFQVKYGIAYDCDHPLYFAGTLYTKEDRGLVIVQQRFNPVTKSTTWTEIDPWLVDELYLHPKFDEYFDKYADKPKDNLYPTVPVRKIMWALKMKPIKKERWETTFDHCPM